jgi:hypothetical protein
MRIGCDRLSEPITILATLVEIKLIAYPTCFGVKNFVVAVISIQKFT